MSTEYTNPLSITSQFSFCGLPFRLDTYSGCAFNCTYCFARLRGGKKFDKTLLPADPHAIIKRFQTSLSDDRHATGIISEVIRRRMPVHFGGMSDPFQPAENTMKVSLKVLEYLCAVQYPTVISTKSTLLSTEPYLSLLRSNRNILVQFSMSSTSDPKAAISEPFAFPPSDILRTIEVLSRASILTTIRWQPFIPNLSEHPEEFVSRLSGLGIKHIGIEHLKLPLEQNSYLWRRLSDNLDFDITTFYKGNGASVQGRELVLPAAFKIRAILQLRTALEKHDITLGVADNELQYLSDNECCCSGIDRFPVFANWNKFQIAYAVKRSGFSEIRFDLIAGEWEPLGSIDQFLNSRSRINKEFRHNTARDYLLARWDDLDSDFNPTRFYGVDYRGKKDDAGMKIFEWDRAMIDPILSPA